MRRGVSVGGGVLVAIGLWAGSLFAQTPQLTPDQQAAQVLDAARRAFNEARYDFAAARFRDFLQQYGNHKDAPAAQYGLALSLLELPQRDYPAAQAALEQVVNRQDFPDRPYALYYLASIRRALGGQALEQAAAKPNEAANFRNTANGHFAEAAKHYAAATEAFAARLKAPPPPPAAGAPAVPPQPAEVEIDWLARARCDHCEMLLRQEKYKEAADLATAFLADPMFEKSRYRELALYQLGHARFSLREYPAAGKALSQLAPYQQEFGVHARYLLARVHHLAEERPEALAHYKALVADFEQQKKIAQEAMKNPGALKIDERSRMEAILKSPPDYVLRAMFYGALVSAEEGKFAEALEVLNQLAQQYPASSIADEVKLRQGFCQLQLRNYPLAIQALQPLHNHAALADRALWWTGRAQIAAADPNNPQALEQAVRGGIDLLNKAAERAGQLAAAEPEAKVRRGDILIEIGDAQQLIKLYRDAAATYQKALTENNNPPRAEEAMQRQATALHLAGQYKESDEVCARFEQAYPKSPLLPAVWFREAENACLTAMAAAADPNMKNRRAEVDKLFDDAIARYQRLIQKFPEFNYIQHARYGLATAQYQRGQYGPALAALTAIPDADRLGDLSGVPYLIADCLIRQFPAETDDALAAGQLIDQAEQAAKLLERYTAAGQKTPQQADAIFKLGYCYQRIALVLVDPAEKQKVLGQARQAYERVLQESQGTPAFASAVMERARCMAFLGDANGAINELGRFQSDPLRSSAVAPLAIIRLGTLLRSQNRAADAVSALNQARSQHEANLRNDPERVAWVPMLQYEHALAVKETGKLPEARGMFEATAKEFAARPEAALCLWRAGQCRREEFQLALATARATLQKAGIQPPEMAAAVKAIDDGLAGLRQTAEFFKAETTRLAPAAGATAGEGYLRMQYEAAWCHRLLAEAEIESARQKLRAQALEKAVAALRKGNLPTPPLTPPDVPLASVPIQPSEKAARDSYAALIAAGRTAAGREHPLAVRAKFELAELLAQRGENDAALEQLAAALDSGPPLELAERIRLRIAACLTAKKEWKAAVAQVQPILKNAQSALLGEARLVAAEANIEGKDWAAAIELLVPFRDQDPLRNTAGLADRALLRLGHALAEAKRWDESRQACEALVQRFPQSPWVYEGRFAIGWAQENQNQHDNAVNSYNEVVRGTASETAARAQLRIGLCRLAQKRYPEAVKELQAVAFGYECPEHTAAALCEAGQAYIELKQPKDAAAVLERVIREHAATRWAETARQRLASIK